MISILNKLLKEPLQLPVLSLVPPKSPWHALEWPPLTRYYAKTMGENKGWVSVKASEAGKGKKQISLESLQKNAALYPFQHFEFRQVTLISNF